MRHEHIIILKSVCNKLFNKEYDFSQEEIDIFMSPYLGDWIQRDATISKQCIESNRELKNIIEKNTTQELDRDEIDIIANYLTGANKLDKAEYLDLFHWFYFNWKTTRISIPLEIWEQSEKSLVKYHDYVITDKSQKDLLNKITSWD